MGWFEWVHPAFKDAINHRPSTNSNHLIFPWDLENKRFSFSEFAPSLRQYLSLEQAQLSISKLERSPNYNPEMRRMNHLVKIASCIGCLNCVILPILLILLMNKMINARPFTVLGIFAVIFCCIWCLCFGLMLNAAYKDIGTLEQRQLDFQNMLDQENLAYFHKYGKSWQVGPFGSYLQFNFDKLYFPNQKGYEYQEEAPLPMSTQRGVYDSGYQ